MRPIIEPTDYLRWLAQASVHNGFVQYGYRIAAVAWAIDAAVRHLEQSNYEFDDRDAEQLVDLVIELGLRA